MKKLLGLQAVAVFALAGCTFSPNQGSGGVGRSQSNIQPQPSACSSLGENACLARADCEGRYGGVCPACTAGSPCPPCSNGFLGCQDKAPADPCSGLNEAQCNASNLCHANYATASCPPCPPNGVCSPCNVQAAFTSCSVNVPPQDPCVGLDESICTMKEPFCQPQYAAVMMACPPSADGGCDMQPIYLGCHGGARTCTSNCDCAVNEYCAVKYFTEPPEVFSEDGGIARCATPPQPSGVCTPAPNDTPIYVGDPTDPIEAKDAGSAPTP